MRSCVCARARVFFLSDDRTRRQEAQELLSLGADRLVEEEEAVHPRHHWQEAAPPMMRSRFDAIGQGNRRITATANEDVIRRHPIGCRVIGCASRTDAI